MESYTIAMREPAPTGVPLHDAERQYVVALNALPEGMSLLEAAKAYAIRHTPYAIRHTPYAMLAQLAQLANGR